MSDPRCSQKAQQERISGCLQYHLLRAAKLAGTLVADMRKLSRKVVLGAVPVSDSVVLAWPFNFYAQSEKCTPCLGKTVPKRVKVIRDLVIAQISNFKMSCSRAKTL